MKFIDTHAHIYAEEFNDDIETIVSRAIDKGISKIVLPNIDSNTIEPMLSLVNKYPNLFIPLMGLHPTHVKENLRSELEIIAHQFEINNYNGVGETGIDLYWDKNLLNLQIEAFEFQLTLAKSKHLPIVIHARESFIEIMEIIDTPAYHGITGVFHAFTGNLEMANKAIDLGFKLGIGGILTFKNSGLAEVIKHIDLKHILLETDSPYLAPVPHRGKRNESSYIPLVAEKLSEIKNIPIETIGEITTKNATELFQL